MELGSLRQRVTIENPTAAVPDGDGGFTQTWIPAVPAQWWAAIETATPRAAERRFSGTVLAHADYIFTGRFHPAIGSQTRLTWTDRASVVHQANVLDVVDLDGAGVESSVLVSEIAT